MNCPLPRAPSTRPGMQHAAAGCSAVGHSSEPYKPFNRAQSGTISHPFCRSVLSRGGWGRHTLSSPSPQTQTQPTVPQSCPLNHMSPNHRSLSDAPPCYHKWPDTCQRRKGDALRCRAAALLCLSFRAAWARARPSKFSLTPFQQKAMLCFGVRPACFLHFSTPRPHPLLHHTLPLPTHLPTTICPQSCLPG